MAKGDRYRVFKILGSSDPENFFLAFIPEALEELGSIVVVSDAAQMTEPEMREYPAKKMNRSAEEIDEVMGSQGAPPSATVN